ncbi:hypothetical protein CHGG_01890 [Chaetomium globosum CBS 148.51]|uniref:Mitochondrial chaperone BCS1 n=1 Tax=Chaetomium globosum (strain ATCC 6205 / CBS 148.51 / DSM 1962 / NBRC 6347 / NRRL 1970) TaxID=306901 RepID=Q2HD14_CHAGB|nr:uncharacterized protein CHGG_01890 [Chaetomium globosum CBS 148.51]EAQ93655.1 hypothetical protein CHGG_01890 [Chaetomium globosum CBS 148.51]
MSPTTTTNPATASQSLHPFFAPPAPTTPASPTTPATTLGTTPGAPPLPSPSPSPSAPSFLGLDTLFTNPVFAGGIGLAGLGAAAAFGRRALISGAGLLRRQLLVNIEISKRDPSYSWVLAWLAQPRDNTGFLAQRLTRLRNLSVTTSTKSLSPRGVDDGNGGGGAGGRIHADFRVQPGFGRHMVRHAPGVYIAVNREKAGTATTATGEPHETLTLTLLWVHRHVLADVFTQAHALAQSFQQGKTVVYTARKMEWAVLGKPRLKRPLGSVVLDEGVKEGLVADVKEFLKAQQWYTDRGVPYRRGYLLYGPPGTGKTSFIQALAGELDYSVAMINLSEMGMTDDLLAQLLTQLPEKSILLLEDVDAALANRRQRDPDGYSGRTVTASGLLNALDGLAAGEDRIAFLTTNHIDRLDPALIRPGRVDMMVRIGEATRYPGSPDVGPLLRRY